MCPFWKQNRFIRLILTSQILRTFAYEHEPLENETTLSDKFEMETLFSWDILKFDLIHNGRKSNVTYVEESNLLGNVRLYKDTFYLSVPRYLDGVPATLNTIKNSRNKTGDLISPILRPFPSLEENLIGDCDALQNVLALEIDPFGRLWIVDSGNAEIYRTGKSNCSAKIKIYQLSQDDAKPKLLFSHSIPTEVANDKSLLMHIVLEFIEQKGSASPDNANKDVFAFISDVANGNIVVFDWRKGVSYKKSSVEMRQSVENFEVLNQQVNSLSGGRSGVRGLALQSQPSLKEQNRILYFGKLGEELFYVPTNVLHDENGNENIDTMVKFAANRTGYCDDMTSDGDGNIYSGILDKGCVSKHFLLEENIQLYQDVICNPDKLVWINSLFWNDGYLFIVTNEFHSFLNRNFYGGDAEDQNNNDRLRRSYEILRVTPKTNSTKNYMDWVVSGGIQSIYANNKSLIIMILFWPCFSVYIFDELHNS